MPGAADVTVLREDIQDGTADHVVMADPEDWSSAGSNSDGADVRGRDPSPRPQWQERPVPP